MNEDRRRILAMLAEGKINADEAERLLAALDRGGSTLPTGPIGDAVTRRAPKYLRVEVDANRSDAGPTKVNIRVPMMMLRAGVRLGALMPPEARAEVNAAMARKGVDFDINQLKPENLETLIENLGELSLNVDNERARVRIYCE
jgi:hypothetical protein